MGASRSSDSDPTLKNCLFGAVTLTKNADIEKYRYSDLLKNIDILIIELDLIEDQVFKFQVLNLVKMY